MEYKCWAATMDVQYNSRQNTCFLHSERFLSGPQLQKKDLAVIFVAQPPDPTKLTPGPRKPLQSEHSQLHQQPLNEL